MPAKHKGFKFVDGDDTRIEVMANPNFRAVLRASQRLGGSAEKISDELKWPLGTAKSRLNRARTVLVSARAGAK